MKTVFVAYLKNHKGQYLDAKTKQPSSRQSSMISGRDITPLLQNYSRLYSFDYETIEVEDAVAAQMAEQGYLVLDKPYRIISD